MKQRMKQSDPRWPPEVTQKCKYCKEGNLWWVNVGPILNPIYRLAGEHGLHTCKSDMEEMREEAVIAGHGNDEFWE